MNETRWRECGLCSFKSLDMGDFHRHLEDQHGTEVLFRAFESEKTMTSKPNNVDTASAMGVILILLGILATLIWGLGADRFLWIAAGTGGAGLLLTTIGALTKRP